MRHIRLASVAERAVAFHNERIDRALAEARRTLDAHFGDAVVCVPTPIVASSLIAPSTIRVHPRLSVALFLQRLIARCAAAISARPVKWKSGVVWVFATGVAPAPSWPWRRSIQAVASPSERAGPMSWY